MWCVSVVFRVYFSAVLGPLGRFSVFSYAAACLLLKLRHRFHLSTLSCVGLVFVLLIDEHF